jgi:uncharacterized damage-inducible protein DinB
MINVPEPIRSIVTAAAIVLFVLLHAAEAAAQENPLTTHNRFTYGYVKMMVMRAAEKTPEEDYSFRPAETVRTFGQIVAHVADAQYRMCSQAMGQPIPPLTAEKTKTTKAEIIGALKDAFAYCDKAYDGLTDASGAEVVKFDSMQAPKLGILYINEIHSIEHYGNLVTYMRMKGIVPPSSEPGFLKKK